MESQEVLALRVAPTFTLSVAKSATTVMKYVPSEAGDGRMCLKEQLIPEEERRAWLQTLQERTEKIYACGRNVAASYVEIGYQLHCISQGNLWKYASIKSQTFQDIFDFAFKVFGFSKTVTYGLMNVVDAYAEKGVLKPEYEGYSYSQLVELLPFGTNERKMFTPEATVAEIREIRKGRRLYPYSKTYYLADFGTKITWESELKRIRAEAAKVAEREAKEKAEKKSERSKGLIEMLDEALAQKASVAESASGSVPAASVAEPVPEEPEEKKLGLKNREARKKWVESVFDGASPHLTIPELDLEIYRYVFANGARLFRFDGVTYWETWSTEPGKEDKVAKYFITDNKCPKFDMCRSRSVNQVVDWLTEHAQEL